jgi:hypothetical protein
VNAAVTMIEKEGARFFVETMLNVLEASMKELVLGPERDETLR